MELNELIAAYIGAWSEPDRVRRQQLLDRVWTAEGTYTDPTAHVEGREALVDHIDKFFKQFPGARLALTSDIDTHHQKLRFTWRMLLADGSVFVEGTDFGELSADGRLERIVGFFERPPRT